MVGKHLGKHLRQNATICGSLRFISIFIAPSQSPISTALLPIFRTFPQYSNVELEGVGGVNGSHLVL
jgi:hypothetical protein